LKGKKIKKILISGHSLGGAMATLAAMDIAQHWPFEGPINIGLYTTGSPKVGDREFKINFEKILLENQNGSLGEVFRIFNVSDPIPNLPKNPAYFHVGITVPFDCSYKTMQNHHPSDCYLYAVHSKDRSIINPNLQTK